MAYDAGKAFARIERELIASMMRNLRRHLNEEEERGFDWSQWQAEQLRYLDEYRRRNRKRLGGQFTSINALIREAIEHGYANGQNAEELRILETLAADKGLLRRTARGALQGAGDAFFRVNEDKLNALLDATERDMRKAEHAVLRRAEDQYRQIIFDAQVYANTGAGTIRQAIDMATHDFLAAGIDCIEYKNGARHNIADYADMVIRTAEKRAYLAGEGRKRQEWGMSLVRVKRRGTMKNGDFAFACPQCIPWIGKVLIDDVYSGGKPDGEHKLLSEAMEAGFLHPRCRDGVTTYFPGLSTEPDEEPVTREEAEQAAEEEAREQRANYVRRQREKYERLAENSLDPGNRQKYEARAEEWKARELELPPESPAGADAYAPEPVPERDRPIQFDERISERQRDMILQLSSEYDTRLERVTTGAERAAGDVDITGSRMRLNDKHVETAIHEFAHTLAMTEADRLGLTDNKEFWKEIRKIRREYRKAVGEDTTRWISFYEHSHKSVDEFMAEAFTHAKMRELGMSVPAKYGNDYTYSQRVLDTVNRYYGKGSSGKSGKKAGGIPVDRKAKGAIIKGNYDPEDIRRAITQKTTNFVIRDINHEDSLYGELCESIPPIKGFYDVKMHGSPTLVKIFNSPVDAAELARIILFRRDYDGGAIRLLSCETGKIQNGTCVAMELSRFLGVDVMAPTEELIATSTGKIIIQSDAKKKGWMRLFHPDGSYEDNF